jgi:uncharacterized protein (DUF1778 family)
MIKTKSTRIEIRINPEIKSIIEKAARIKGKTLSAYIIGNSLSNAQKDIEKLEMLSLDKKDRDMFYNLIVNPPVPNKALKNLMKNKSS